MNRSVFLQRRRRDSRALYLCVCVSLSLSFSLCLSVSASHPSEMCTHSGKVTICKPGRQHTPQLDHTGAPISTFSLQKCEKVNLCHLTAQSVVFCYGSPSKMLRKQPLQSAEQLHPPTPMFLLFLL